jgi:hypothetical protein
MLLFNTASIRLTLKRQAQCEMSAEADVHADEQAGRRMALSARDTGLAEDLPFSESVCSPYVKVSATSL